MANPINYAEQYARELAQAYPYVLNFGALYATENNGRYRMGDDGKTVYIPHLTTTGRVNADRDTIATAARNYDNAWEPKVLRNQRKWSTLVHPKDIDETNGAASIANITQTYNETQKFPEMDAYLASTLYTDWAAEGNVADHTVLTEDNILEVIDDLMLKADNALVPVNGRLLYCTHEAKSMIKRAKGLTRNYDVQSGGTVVTRGVSRIDELEIIGVPKQLMKTAYDFTLGWKPLAGADQINLMLVHPSAVITPVSYQYSQLDPPAAVTEGKYIYYEESFEDVFMLNMRSGALQYNTTVEKTDDNRLRSLTIGKNEITPAFDPDTTSYTAATTAETMTVKAVSVDPDADIEIKLKGASQGTGVGSLEKVVKLSGGSNAITVEAKTTGGVKTYTVTVTKS